MVERAERRFSTWTDREREDQELRRLGEVEGFIQFKATDLSMGDPMFAEDLAQQAREAVIRRLRKHPDCPYSHLVNKARDAILNYRKKGHSVDRPYQGKRARQYHIISFEKPISTEAVPFEEKPLLREFLSDPAQPRRVTEERACANVLLDSLRERLSPEGNQVLTLRLMGVSWKEAGEILGQGAGEITRMRQSIKETSQVIWSVSVPNRAGSVCVDNADEGSNFPRSTLPVPLVRSTPGRGQTGKI